jgi:hypothetical protein
MPGTCSRKLLKLQQTIEGRLEVCMPEGCGNAPMRAGTSSLVKTTRQFIKLGSNKGMVAEPKRLDRVFNYA